jgi:hypothetical protein
MRFVVLGRRLDLFTGYLLHNLRLQAASRYRPIAFDPEGSSLRSLLTGELSGLASGHRDPEIQLPASDFFSLNRFNSSSKEPVVRILLNWER